MENGKKDIKKPTGEGSVTSITLNPFWYPTQETIELFKKNPDKIDWHLLSLNPAAIHLLEQNPNKIDWHGLSANTSAIHLIREALENNPDKIDWSELSSNPSLNLISSCDSTSESLTP